jgi:hypothetical protein
MREHINYVFTPARAVVFQPDGRQAFALTPRKTLVHTLQSPLVTKPEQWLVSQIAYTLTNS